MMGHLKGLLSKESQSRVQMTARRGLSQNPTRQHGGPSHHRTERGGEEEDQKKKNQNVEEGSGPKWIYVLWVI